MSLVAGSRFGIVTRFLRDDSGQDLIEYALLTVLIGLSCLGAWSVIEAALGNAYTTYDTANQSLWIPPDPPSGGSP